MRYGSLWSGVVFKKEVIFREFDFETLLEFEVSKSSIWKHTKEYFFLSILSRNFDDQLSSNFHRFAIFFRCLDTQKYEDWSLTLKVISILFDLLLFFSGILTFQSFGLWMIKQIYQQLSSNCLQTFSNKMFASN